MSIVNGPDSCNCFFSVAAIDMAISVFCSDSIAHHDPVTTASRKEDNATAAMLRRVTGRVLQMRDGWDDDDDDDDGQSFPKQCGHT